MNYVGIDVAKYKNDCIITSKGKTVHDVFTFGNNKIGFITFYRFLASLLPLELRMRLEATSHYILNLVAFIDSKRLPLIVLNPLSVNLCRKSTMLRKTETGKIDRLVIFQMIHSCDHKSYSPVSYHLRELKILTKHRYRLIKDQSKLKHLSHDSTKYRFQNFQIILDLCIRSLLMNCLRDIHRLQ